jgi:outer membrane receptor protein involved in Fe transport
MRMTAEVLLMGLLSIGVDSPAGGGIGRFAAATTQPSLRGVVIDSSGAAVPGATVRIESGMAEAGASTTGADGRFVLDGAAGAGVTLRASAPGFADTTVDVAAADLGSDVIIVLHPAPVVDVLTVTASRSQERLPGPASATVVTAAELFNAAAGSLDDALRRTPGFSLFRRSSSRVANPTTQGVTLRGVSGSGASRTLVLADGFALNDPFGSWVYWNRIPLAAIDRVELVRGAAGDLYGADALGGVIQVLTFTPARPRLRATLDGGSHETARTSVYAGGQARRWTGSVAGEWLATDGVPVVAQDQRGTVDVPADSDYRTAALSLGVTRGEWRAGVRGSVYSEERGNGTPKTINDTEWRQIGGDAGGGAGGGAWQARIAGGTQSYDQTFSAVAADRRTERLTTAQHIPTTFVAAGGEWSRPWGAHSMLVGADVRHTDSTLYETRYSLAGVPSGPFLTGGTERVVSVFARANLVPAQPVTLVVGARGDFWRSDPLDPAAAARAVSFFSPRVSASWRLDPRVSLQAAAYRAYRTPTLNELHRGFRVGNVVTSANPGLDPERLTGAEAGAWVSARGLSVRMIGFWNHLDGAVANITVRTTPALITRERQNADRVRAAGLELEADFRPSPSLVVSGLAVFTWSHFRPSLKQPALDGNRVPQVPRAQLGATVIYTNPRLATLSADLRWSGHQFDDDQNLFLLESFGVVDLLVSRQIVRGVQGFAALENVGNTEYDTGRTPIRTVGWPRTFRTGVRWFRP